MTRAIRPVVTFVLRLWREPGDQEGDASWRGLIRSLDATDAEKERVFRGLENLVETLRPWLVGVETPLREPGDDELL